MPNPKTIPEFSGPKYMMPKVVRFKQRSYHAEAAAMSIKQLDVSERGAWTLVEQWCGIKVG